MTVHKYSVPFGRAAVWAVHSHPKAAPSRLSPHQYLMKLPVLQRPNRQDDAVGVYTCGARVETGVAGKFDLC
jgi:hypothetical protein